jgi:hypothetical protein
MAMVLLTDCRQIALNDNRHAFYSPSPGEHTDV